jgi:hypothetical protein
MTERAFIDHQGAALTHLIFPSFAATLLALAS